MIFALWVHYNQQYNIFELQEKKLNFHRKYEAYNSEKHGLVGSNIQMVENTLWTRSLALLTIHYNLH